MKQKSSLQEHSEGESIKLQDFILAMLLRLLWYVMWKGKRSLKEPSEGESTRQEASFVCDASRRKVCYKSTMTVSQYLKH